MRERVIPQLSSILTAIEGACQVLGRTDRDVRGVRYDSRTVEPGDLFVAVNGRDDRGVEFVPTAIQAGAAAVITDAEERMPAAMIAENDVTLIVVGNARRAMAQIAQALAGLPAERLRLLGVTGTNGKTTAAYVLRQLLNACGERVGLIGTLGKLVDHMVPTGYTTPEAPELATILAEMVEGGMTMVAMEVSSHALVLERVAGLRFAAAAFTNLTQDHLDFHDSMEAYLLAKKRLFDDLPAGHPAAVNIDDPNGEAMLRDTRGTPYRYGAGPNADLRIADLELTPERSRWRLCIADRFGGGELFLETRLLGAFNVWNVTAAFAIGMGLGFSREQLAAAVPTLLPVPGRMQSVALGNGATAVIDYAHTPDALERVLEALRHLGGAAARITAVFGCGGDRDRTKRPLMGAAAARLADRVVLTADNPRSEAPDAITDDIMAGIPAGTDVRRVADRAEAIAIALDEAVPGDLVLIAGKGHEDYQIIGGERRHFSDEEQVADWIRHNAGR